MRDFGIINQMDLPKYDAIFVIGPQGSGKGTQGKALAAKLGYFYWEMGGILRHVAKENTEFGRKVKSFADAGKLLSDEDILEVQVSKLPEAIAMQNGKILFDGVPRTVPQGVNLVNYLKQNGFSKFGAIHIDVPREESVKRLLKRAEQEGRADDTPEKINYRLDLYEKATKPVLQFLAGIGDMNVINGVGTIDEVAERINKIFED